MSTDPIAFSAEHFGTTRWTFAFDESGAFEGNLVAGERDERVGWVVGGVLLPGGAAETTRALEGFRAWCKSSVGFPPHARDFDGDTRAALAHAAGEAVARMWGVWLFVVSPAEKSGRASTLGRFVRMYGAAVDWAGRLVATLGGSEIDARPAQRSVPLAPEAMAESKERGMAAEVTGDDGWPLARAMLQAETRHALEALSREPSGALAGYPKLASVVVEAATYGGAHTGLSLADVGCNRVYGGLGAKGGMSLDEAMLAFAGAPVLVLEVEALRALRALDRALRDDPADLVLAGSLVARLLGDLSATSETKVAEDRRAHKVTRQSAAGAAELLWNSALRRLAARAHLSALAVSLAARAEALLAQKKGSYEGVWRALRDGFAGPGELAVAMRAACTDRVLAARLFRLTVECANHRGDVPAAEDAAARFHEIVRHGRSYRLLGEELIVRNVAVVTAQNKLPSEEASVGDARAQIDLETRSLLARLDHAGEVMSLAADDEGSMLGSSDAPSAHHEVAETALWRVLAATAPSFEAPDRERGMGYGTVARSYAFLGQLSEARRMAMRARRLFADSPFDLYFNAQLLARIEIESARLGKSPRGEVLDALLPLAGATALLNPTRARDVAKEPALRFPLDLLLRALLWTSTAGGPSLAQAAPLVELLSSEPFFLALSRGEMRSHPTELLARHIGELLRKVGAPGTASHRWFALALALCEEAPAGSTIARLGGFTQRLFAEPNFGSEGEPGSLHNPTFEHR